MLCKCIVLSVWSVKMGNNHTKKKKKKKKKKIKLNKIKLNFLLKLEDGIKVIEKKTEFVRTVIIINSVMNFTIF